MNATEHEPARLDFDEYVIRLTDCLLDFVEEEEDREDLRRIAQRIISTRGAA